MARARYETCVPGPYLDSHNGLIAATLPLLVMAPSH
jgi:hypothetical protein